MGENNKKNQPVFSIIKKRAPSPLQQFGCRNVLRWQQDCDCYFDLVNSEYPFLHKHTYWEIQIMEDGKVNHFINNKQLAITRGDCFIIRPNDEHAVFLKEKAKESKIFFINFVVSEDYITSIFESYDKGLTNELLNSSSPLHFKLLQTTLSDVANSCFNIQLLNRVDQKSAKIECKLLVNKLISEYIEQRVITAKQKPEWLNDFIYYLNSTESFTKSIDEISKTTPYSYSRLSHLFKEWFNTSIIDYRNQIKLEYSSSLISSGNNSIAEIVYLLGFNSLSYYTHLFKRTYGITPSEYKKQFVNSLKEK